MPEIIVAVVSVVAAIAGVIGSAKKMGDDTGFARRQEELRLKEQSIKESQQAFELGVKRATQNRNERIRLGAFKQAMFGQGFGEDSTALSRGLQSITTESVGIQSRATTRDQFEQQLNTITRDAIRNDATRAVNDATNKGISDIAQGAVDLTKAGVDLHAEIT